MNITIDGNPDAAEATISLAEGESFFGRERRDDAHEPIGSNKTTSKRRFSSVRLPVRLLVANRL